MVEEKNEVKAVARARILVEIDCVGLWGADCTIGQLNKQAREGATITLQQKLKACGLRIIDTPTITGILTEKRDG